MSEQAPGRRSLAERQAAVEARLGQLVGLVHPRLAAAVMRGTTDKDSKTALLTYGEITARQSTANDRIPGIPDAVPCGGPDVECSLAEAHLNRLDAYLTDPSQSKGPRYVPPELAGWPVRDLYYVRERFNLEQDEALHPTVEGTEWYIALVVSLDGNSDVIIFAPWMSTDEKCASPMPILYMRGDPAIEDVREIAAAYAEFRSQDPMPGSGQAGA